MVLSKTDETTDFSAFTLNSVSVLWKTHSSNLDRNQKPIVPPWALNKHVAPLAVHDAVLKMLYWNWFFQLFNNIEMSSWTLGYMAVRWLWLQFQQRACGCFQKCQRLGPYNRNKGIKTKQKQKKPFGIKQSLLLLSSWLSKSWLLIVCVLCDFKVHVGTW